MNGWWLRAVRAEETVRPHRSSVRIAWPLNSCTLNTAVSHLRILLIE